MKNKHSRRGITGRVEAALELPKGTLTDQPHLEISGRHEVIVEGCHGIVSYDDDAVRMDTGCGILRIMGKGLVLRAMSGDAAAVSGRIVSVEFTAEKE